jgi:hypothetical protein
MDNAWPAWEKDRQLAEHYVGVLNDAMLDAVNPADLAAQWQDRITIPQRLSPGAAESFLISQGVDRALTDAITPIILELWWEAWQLGIESANSQVQNKMLAKVDDHHVPGTPYEYRHGWIPLNGAVEDVIPKVQYNGMPHPSQESLDMARKMVQHDEGISPSNHEITSLELANALDREPPELRAALSKRFTVHVTNDTNPDDDIPGSEKDNLAMTGPFKKAGWSRWQIRLLDKLLLDPANYNKKYDKFAMSGGSVRSDDRDSQYHALRYTIAHELGHALWDEVVLQKNGSDGSNVHVSREQGEGVLNALFSGLAGHDHPTDDEKDIAFGNMSEYGTTSFQEMMAEAYAANALDGIVPGVPQPRAAARAGKSFQAYVRQQFTEARQFAQAQK